MSEKNIRLIIGIVVGLAIGAFGYHFAEKHMSSSSATTEANDELARKKHRNFNPKTHSFKIMRLKELNRDHIDLLTDAVDSNTSPYDATLLNYANDSIIDSVSVANAASAITITAATDAASAATNYNLNSSSLTEYTSLTPNSPIKNTQHILSSFASHHGIVAGIAADGVTPDTFNINNIVYVRMTTSIVGGNPVPTVVFGVVNVELTPAAMPPTHESN